MALQFRFGNEADFDPTKLLASEPAYATDNKKLYIANGDGSVRTVMFIEDYDAGTGGNNTREVDRARAADSATPGSSLDNKTGYTIIGSDDDKCIKYNDGRMTAIKRVQMTNIAVTTAWGNMYWSGTVYGIGNFQVPFIDTPKASLNVFGNANACILVGQAAPTTTAWPTFLFGRGSSISSMPSVEIHATAEGRWK